MYGQALSCQYKKEESLKYALPKRRKISDSENIVSRRYLHIVNRTRIIADARV